MKIKDENDVHELDLRIQSELGLDLKKYRNDEVVEKILSLLVFPEYFFTWVIGPVIFALLCYAAGFIFFDLSAFTIGLYIVLGLLLFLFSGLSFGLLMLTGRMKTDIVEIIQHTKMTVSSIRVDASDVLSQMSPGKRKASISMLFKGVLHLITIPTLTVAIKAKIPIVGGLLSWMTRKVLTAISNSVEFSDSLPHTSSSDIPGVAPEKVLDENHNSSKVLRKVINVSFGLVRMPIKVIFVTSTIILLLFIWVIC